MQIAGSAKLSLEYDQEDLPPSIKQFKPVVFKEGNAFCCLLGPDTRSGIFGCGDSVEQTI